MVSLLDRLSRIGTSLLFRFQIFHRGVYFFRLNCCDLVGGGDELVGVFRNEGIEGLMVFFSNFCI